MNCAEFVKARFSIMRAIAVMYNQVHVAYLDQGLELLHDLGRAGSPAARAGRQRALETYCARTATEVEDYVDRVGCFRVKARTVLTGDRGGIASRRNSGWGCADDEGCARPGVD